MKCASLAAILFLAACSTPEPVLIRPNIQASLFECTPAPPRPDRMTVNDALNRSDQWANAFDECQCRLWVVRSITQGTDLHPCFDELETTDGT